MKTLKIVQVKTIFNENVKKPIVVYVTAQGIDVARTPKQALLDMQNSGRCLLLPSNALDGGIVNANQMVLSIFKKELFKLVGATVSGEIRPFKAGDTFVYTEGHPALTDKTHEQYNKVKLGDKGVAEGDGVWIDGFLNIPLSHSEREIEAYAEAKAFASIFGMGTTDVHSSSTNTDDFESPEDTPEEMVSKEAIGSSTKVK